VFLGSLTSTGTYDTVFDEYDVGGITFLRTQAHAAEGLAV
jgi:hypothetical protein